MKHKVKINLITKDNRKQTLFSHKTVRLPARIVRFLFGDATQILVMKPGQSVETVEFFELPPQK